MGIYSRLIAMFFIASTIYLGNRVVNTEHQLNKYRDRWLNCVCKDKANWETCKALNREVGK